MVGGGGTGPCAGTVPSFRSVGNHASGWLQVDLTFLPPHRVESTYEDIAAAVEGELPNLGRESRSVDENEQYSGEIKRLDERVTGER